AFIQGCSPPVFLHPANIPKPTLPPHAPPGLHPPQPAPAAPAPPDPQDYPGQSQHSAASLASAAATMPYAEIGGETPPRSLPTTPPGRSAPTAARSATRVPQKPAPCDSTGIPPGTHHNRKPNHPSAPAVP